MMVHAEEGKSDDPRAFWITTFTHLKFYPKDPEGSTYRIEDIAHALSQTCRFGGQCREFYSVAEHSVHVSTLAEKRAFPSMAGRVAKAALLHDASEAYLCDIPRPVKYLPEMLGYRALEKRVEAAITAEFDLESWHREIKEADLLMLRAEADQLGLLNPDWDVFGWIDCGLKIGPLSPKDAEAAFLKRWRNVEKVETASPGKVGRYGRPCQFCGSYECGGGC